MLVTVSWIERNYNKFNQLYFGGTLPRIQFKTSRSKHAWGLAGYDYDYENSTIIPTFIAISNYYDSPESVKIQSLLHEMIHIEDYFWHPEHYIQNGKRIRKNQYDPHGWWFLKEAKRIKEESGYDISEKVTKFEKECSTISGHSQKLINNKIKNGRVIAAFNGNSVWYFKTDVNKINNVRKLIKIHLPDYNKIWECTFNSISLANKVSCNTRLRGWHVTKIEFMNIANFYKFTTIKSYTI